jgi:DNA-binding NtrC family response regulator
MSEEDKQAPVDFAHPKLLCVEREAGLTRKIMRIFSDSALKVTGENRIQRVLDRFDDDFFDVVVLSSDAALTDHEEYLELLEILAAECPATQVLLLIHPSEIELAASALEIGSYHYSKLPISEKELRLLIDAALANRPDTAPDLLIGRGPRPKGFQDMIGSSQPMTEVYQLIRQAAGTDIPVLITGETGTGKDLAARAIHELSSRCAHPYTPVHLGALPRELVASELFGHERGAFTGATERREGCFERSHEGTVFLDEISTIDDRMQISLLRLLETKTFSRIGGNVKVAADVRVIAASNEDLLEVVRHGDFREDLYYRMEVFQITMPPLRHRDGDLAQLASHFLKHYCGEYNKRISGLTTDCMACLQAYDWPGNVRELKNVIHRAVVICSEAMIGTEHLSERVRTGSPHPEDIVLPVGTSLETAEREIILETLKSTGFNRRRTAELLGISRGTMYNKIKKYKLAK